MESALSLLITHCFTDTIDEGLLGFITSLTHLWCFKVSTKVGKTWLRIPALPLRSSMWPQVDYFSLYFSVLICRMGLIVALTQEWPWGVEEWMLVKPWAVLQSTGVAVRNTILIVIARVKGCAGPYTWANPTGSPRGSRLQTSPSQPLTLWHHSPPSFPSPGPAHTPIQPC